MIFANRISISGTLTLHSDLHIGTHEVNEYTDNKGIIREFSPTMRNQDDKPIIPASSLKGVLRAILTGEGASHLFGHASNHGDGSGQAALLWLDHAALSSPASGLDMLSDTPAKNGTYLAKHVALDPRTGAAEDHKLFTREMVGRGANFTFYADWFGDDLIKLAPVLAQLKAGIQLGHGNTKGHGLITLDVGTLVLTEYLPQPHGGLAIKTLNTETLIKAINNISLIDTKTKILSITLTGEGPYLSVREVGGETNSNCSMPLERDGKPILWPESLAGALRNRARWLAGIISDVDDNVDNPNADRTPDELRNLTEVETLFGVTGRRGALVVRNIECTNAGNRVVFTSNSIDRFTGATRDAVLFEKKAFWQPEFTAELEVTGEHPIVDKLLDSLRAEGLELGHGASTGFGWFKVEVNNDGK